LPESRTLTGEGGLPSKQKLEFREVNSRGDKDYRSQFVNLTGGVLAMGLSWVKRTLSSRSQEGKGILQILYGYEKRGGTRSRYARRNGSAWCRKDSGRERAVQKAERE